MTRSRTLDRRAGYTLIEIMVAVGIMTVGGVGIMAMQQATTRGNNFARNNAVATHINGVWANRMRRDARNWSVAGQPPAAAQYLTAVPAVPATIGTWFLPAPTTVVPDSTGTTPESAAADFQGMDVNPAGGFEYCTHVRLRWIVPNQQVRADIRTWWNRVSANDALISNRAAFTCTAAGVANVTTALDGANTLHAVYSSIIVRYSRPPR